MISDEQPMDKLNCRKLKLQHSWWRQKSKVPSTKENDGTTAVETMVTTGLETGDGEAASSVFGFVMQQKQ